MTRESVTREPGQGGKFRTRGDGFPPFADPSCVEVNRVRCSPGRYGGHPILESHAKHLRQVMEPVGCEPVRNRRDPLMTEIAPSHRDVHPATDI